MKTVEEIINEFKTKDLSNIKHKYSESEIAMAKFEYIKNYNFRNDNTSYINYLTPQDKIFPVKDNSSLAWLCIMLYFFHKSLLTKEIYKYVKDKDLIFKGSTKVDGDKDLSWEFNNEDNFLTIQYQDTNSSIPRIALENNDTKSIESHIGCDVDPLIMGIAHFIYINTKEGKL